MHRESLLVNVSWMWDFIALYGAFRLIGYLLYQVPVQKSLLFFFSALTKLHEYPMYVA